MPHGFTSDRLQSSLNIGIVLCVGLFPSVYLTSLQAASLFILIGAILNAKTAFKGGFQLRWHHIAIAQFLVLSLVNALYFPVLEGNKPHFLSLAIEALSLSLVLFGALMVFMQNRPDMEHVWTQWLPVGLTLSFLIMSIYYFGGFQGNRVQAFASTSLYPPMWFLTLTLMSFCGFASMSRRDKIIRYGVLGMAALMTIYAGGRLSMIAWVIAFLFLVIQLLPKDDPRARSQALVMISAGFTFMIAFVFLIDHLNNGTMFFRLYFTLETLLSGQASGTFLRLEIWSAAWQLIMERPIFGHGQINERFLLHLILERDWWFRSHQTYLSYWVAGGLVGLVSGIVFQLSAFSMFKQPASGALRPAAFGLVLMLGMHGLTESVFQAFVSVQMFILLVMLRTPASKA